MLSRSQLLVHAKVVLFDLLCSKGQNLIFTMIDFHCHILPSIDDGAVSIDESIAMAKALSSFGYKTVCCTPHCVKGYYDIAPQKVREATLMLQADLDNADVQLELWSGMEYMLDEHFSEFADDLLPLGDTKLVLCEAPFQADQWHVLQGLKLIREKGFVPLIAHPERSPYFYKVLSGSGTTGAVRVKADDQSYRREKHMGQKNQLRVKGFLKKLWPFASRVQYPEQEGACCTLKDLPDTCLFQANLGSFTGYYGPQVQARAYELLKKNEFTGIASDLHDGASAAQILHHDKLSFNPLLRKLADWKGDVSSVSNIYSKKEGVQAELF